MKFIKIFEVFHGRHCYLMLDLLENQGLLKGNKIKDRSVNDI